MNVKNKKVQQSEATRAELIRVASDLFAERGYAGAALEDIAGKAGLTKGALYHHFRDKRALFGACVGQLLEDDLARIQEESKELTADKGHNSWARLFLMIDLFLDGFLNPRLRRIVWVDGPAVLGWERWHEVVTRPAMGRIGGVVSVVVEQGVIEPRFERPLAHVFFGALQEVGLSIAHATDPKAKREELLPAVHFVAAKLFDAPPRSVPA